MSQYYESSKCIPNLFFVTPYTFILDDSIKLSPTLILTADNSTLLSLPGVFYKIKNFFFLLWVNLYMITETYLHDPPPFNSPFFTTTPFFAVSKSCDPTSVSTPPLLISDKSLNRYQYYSENLLIGTSLQCVSTKTIWHRDRLKHDVAGCFFFFYL